MELNLYSFLSVYAEQSSKSEDEAFAQKTWISYPFFQNFPVS